MINVLGIVLKGVMWTWRKKSRRRRIREQRYRKKIPARISRKIGEEKEKKRISI